MFHETHAFFLITNYLRRDFTAFNYMYLVKIHVSNLIKKQLQVTFYVYEYEWNIALHATVIKSYLEFIYGSSKRWSMNYCTVEPLNYV